MTILLFLLIFTVGLVAGVAGQTYRLTRQPPGQRCICRHTAIRHRDYRGELSNCNRGTCGCRRYELPAEWNRKVQAVEDRMYKEMGL